MDNFRLADHPFSIRLFPPSIPIGLLIARRDALVHAGSGLK